MKKLEKLEINLSDQEFLSLVYIYIQKQDKITQLIFEEEIEDLKNKNPSIEQIKTALFNTIISKESNIVLNNYVLENKQISFNF